MSEKKYPIDDWHKYIPVMTNVQDRTGISIEWQKLWSEIENWYGDVKKQESGEQFLKRMQATYFVQPGAVWVKAVDFKYVPGAPYHAKDNLSKGAGKFDIYGQFIWGDGSVTLPRDFESLLILDESGISTPLTQSRADFIREANNRDLGGTAAGRDAIQRIKDFNLSDVDAPVFTHTKEFAAHFSYIKGKLMDIIKNP